MAAGQPREELLEASFRFLLEREPNTAILGEFDLPLIGGYFPSAAMSGGAFRAVTL